MRISSASRRNWKRSKKSGTFKKSLGRVYQTKLVTYVFIEKHRVVYRLTRMCKVLGVSRSGYYAWKKRKPGKRWNEHELLLDRIQVIYQTK